MSWVTVLIIALASLAFVLAAFAYVGSKAWRLLKRGMSIAREVAPLAEELSRRSGELEANAARLTVRSGELSADLERLQASVARLQIIGEALAHAIQPYRRLRDYVGK